MWVWWQEEAEDNPVVMLESWKRGKCDNKRDLKGLPFFVFGRVEDCHYKLEHPSVSRIHAILATDKKLGVLLTDLGSAQASDTL